MGFGHTRGTELNKSETMRGRDTCGLLQLGMRYHDVGKPTKPCIDAVYHCVCDVYEVR